MSRLTREELHEMRRLATRGYVPFWGTIDAERPGDFEITLRRSQIADYQSSGSPRRPHRRVRANGVWL
jgi:hypothetical protein